MCHYDRKTVGRHLCTKGFVEDYLIWNCHGESHDDFVVDQDLHESSPTENDNKETFENVVIDAIPPETREGYNNVEEPNKEAREFFNLMDEANTPLYEGSDQTVLEWCAEFLTYKTQHSISAAACDNMLKLSLKLLKPEGENKLPRTFSQLKTLMRGMGLKHVTYDACINSDFLYYGADADLEKCPVCKANRYKDKKSVTGKKIAEKKLWYFPITSRLQRLFMSRKTAEHMVWHKEYKEDPNKIIHPAGAKAWKDFDNKYPEFAADARNVRLGLCTDGFSPHGKSSYSCWPVFLTPYNLPPDLCMKDESIFLSLIIPGKSSPGVNIDVFLRPLIDELKTLWNDGRVTYDSFKQQNFTMRAAVLWTISDFPAYGMLSGWSTHGKLACPYCMGDTKSFQLSNGGKASWFDCHRRFLDKKHPARKDTKNFTRGRRETSFRQERLSGAEVYNSVQNIPGAERGRASTKHPKYGIDHNWRNKSIFWELPYWSLVLIRHNLDVMHIEKNFFENIFRTIMDDPDKTKDNIKSRLDLEGITERSDLFLIRKPGGKAIKPTTTYVLDKGQRKRVCQWLKDLRFPDAHVSNLSQYVKDVETGRLYHNMKCHDCHVFMQRLLPIAFRDFLPDNIWSALTEVSNFFRALCATDINPKQMEVLGEKIIETICKLEMFFPPSFFDSMEHIAIHLPYEALVGGPVFYRWMYPFERKMFVLKSMIKNKNRVEGSICEAYLNSEISNFCSHYFDREIDTRPKRLKRNENLWEPEFENQLSIFVPKWSTIGRSSERGLSAKEYNAAMYYILMNCEEVDPWFREFDEKFGGTMNDQQLEDYRTKEFVKWFRNTILTIPKGEVDERLRTLAAGGRDIVNTYRGCTINGLKFHTEAGCQHLRTMNSGVCLRSTSGDYYGMIQEVIKMSFGEFGPEQNTVLFKCIWYSEKATTVHPKYGFIDINPKHLLKTDDVFILAAQASQVYYAPYPSSQTHRERKDNFAVCINRARHVINVASLTTYNNEVDREQYYQDEDPPECSRVATDLSQYIVPNLVVDGDGEIIDLTLDVGDVDDGDENNIEESPQQDEEELFADSEEDDFP